MRSGEGTADTRTRDASRRVVVSHARRALALAAVVSSLVLVVRPLGAQTVPMTDLGRPASATIPALKDVGLDQKLNAQIPLDDAFVDENGRDVKLGDYFGTRPVVLALVYYRCPMLCTLVLSGLVNAMHGVTFNAGQQYDVVAVSFDPGETPALAAETKATYVDHYRRTGSESGFHFLTGREANIRRLTDAVGFKYTYDAAINQYAHPALVTVLTPSGRVSRYLLGIDFGATDLRLALVEASAGRVGTLADQTLLYCYHYDPASGRYSVAVMSLVRLGGVITVAGIALSIWLTVRRDRRQANAVRHTAMGAR